MTYITTKSGGEIMLPNNDFVFKLIFADPRRKHLLVSLLRAILDLPDDEYDVRIINPYLPKDDKTGKLGIVDVLLSTPQGKKISIEMQVSPQDCFEERLVFGKSKLITGQIAEGDRYSAIKKVICIAITDYDLYDDKFCHHRFRPYDENAKIYFKDIEEIDIIELTKTALQAEGSLKIWLRYLNAKTEEELMEAARQSAETQEAVESLYFYSADAEARRGYDRQQMLLMDIKAQLSYEWRQKEARYKAQHARDQRRYDEAQRRIAEDQRRMAEMAARIAELERQKE
jgi:predicted transposase/invertase (TIGR01784 family)